MCVTIIRCIVHQQCIRRWSEVSVDDIRKKTKKKKKKSFFFSASTIFLFGQRPSSADTSKIQHITQEFFFFVRRSTSDEVISPNIVLLFFRDFTYLNFVYTCRVRNAPVNLLYTNK